MPMTTDNGGVATRATTRGGWWLSFTGLVPLALTVPLLTFKLWSLGIAASLAGGVAVIAYHLRLGQGVSTLDLVTVGFGAINAVLYFGFGSTALLELLDVFVYSVLALQVAVSLIGKTPWTVQFAKRLADPALLSTPQFLAINRVTTIVWAAAFLLCDLAAILVDGRARMLIPAALLGLTAFLTPRIARAYRERLSPQDAM